MFEKVNPSHPDKVADRIAGAIVDLAYKVEKDPKVAVEVLIGHGVCYVIGNRCRYFCRADQAHCYPYCGVNGSYF
jgi:S-adenosylmethionine synthetase